MKIISPLLLTAVFSLAALANDPNMKAFPPAEKGQARFVINVPKQADENAFKVELIIGKTVKADPVNHFFFGGKLETETIQGWGFDRYILRKIGPMAGTLIGVAPGTADVDRFVPIGGEPQLLRYNSRLPLVVYVPEGVEVRHRIWRADTKAEVAKQG